MHAKIDCTFSVRAFSFKNITLKCFRAFSFLEFCQIFHRGHFPLYEGHFPLGHFLCSPYMFTLFFGGTGVGSGPP